MLEVIFGIATVVLAAMHYILSNWQGDAQSGGGSNSTNPTVHGSEGRTDVTRCVCVLYLLQSCRPYTSGIVWLVTGTTVYFATHKPMLICAAMSLPMLLVTMAGFLLNDIGDRVKDRIAGRPRPIAAGLVSVRQAMVAAVLLLVGAVSCDWHSGCSQSHAIILAASVGVAIYTSLAHAIPLAKGLLTCLLCLTPFLYGAFIANTGFPWPTYAVLTVFIIGRELLLDLNDVRGDYAFGMKTIPHYFGDVASLVVAFTLMVVAGSVTPFVVLHTFARVLSVLGLTALIVSGVYWPHDRNTSIIASRVAYLFGGIALATTVVGGS